MIVPARPLRCLTIGSSDSSGGAGVQGDLKAFTALGGYGLTVVVGVTAQNTLGVLRRHSVPPDVVAAQLDAVLEDIGVDTVKVGTTWSAEVVELAAAKLAALACPVVVDPVLRTASGAALGAGPGELDAVRRHLLPVATVITPNLQEARLLAGAPDGGTPAELAEALAGMGAAAVLVTDVTGVAAAAGAGPDGGPDSGGDWLFDGRNHHAIAGRRHRTGCEHGAGCAHSAALAVLLASGLPLPDAAHEAHRLVSAAVRHGAAHIGRGVHPVDVMAAMDAFATSGAGGP